MHQGSPRFWGFLLPTIKGVTVACLLLSSMSLLTTRIESLVNVLCGLQRLAFRRNLLTAALHIAKSWWLLIPGPHAFQRTTLKTWKGPRDEATYPPYIHSLNAHTHTYYTCAHTISYTYSDSQDLSPSLMSDWLLHYLAIPPWRTITIMLPTLTSFIRSASPTSASQPLMTPLCLKNVRYTLHMFNAWTVAKLL